QLYVRRTDSIIYVIDSANVERMRECKDELDHLFREQCIPAGIPIIIILNKIDLPESMREAEVTERLDLKRHNREFTIVNCCAITGAGLTDFVNRVNGMINENRFVSLKKS
ncbi:hypothetical protein PFISCL1PPCAC_26465, partial [Pristionchus fissidentatus]